MGERVVSVRGVVDEELFDGNASENEEPQNMDNGKEAKKKGGLFKGLFRRKVKKKSTLPRLLDKDGHREEVDRSITAPELVEVEKGLITVNGIPIILSYISAYPAKVYEGWIADEFTWKPFRLDFVQFIEPMNEDRVIAELNRKITSLEGKLAEMRSQGRIDTQSIEQELEYLYRYRDMLTARQTRLFTLSTYFGISPVNGDRNAAEDAYAEFQQKMKSKGAQPKRIRYKMLDAFKCFLPEGKDLLRRKVLVDSEAAASCFPFAFPTIMHPTGVLYGFDAATKAPIIIDRFSFAGHNEVVVGQIGSGKSFFTKLEILRWYLNDPRIKIFLVDPLSGFADLADVLGAQRVMVGKVTMNPLDVFVKEGTSTSEAIREKLMSLMEFFSTFFEEEVGSPLDKTESGVLRKAILKAYAEKGTGRDGPTIDDVISAIDRVVGSDEERTAAARMKPSLEAFSKESEMGIFNGKTEVDIYGRVVYFDFSAVEGVIRSPLLLHAVLTWIASRVKGEEGRKIVVIDEAHYFMKYRQIRSFLEREVRHSRHYMVGYTMISQGFEEFIAHDEGGVILSNASVVVIFRLASLPPDVKKMLNIPASGEKFVREAAQGKVSGYSSALVVVQGYGNYHMNVLASPGELEFLSTAGRGV